MPTSPKIVRVRSSVADNIDRIVENGFYTSRQDWILQSMRHLYEHISRMIVSTTEAADDEAVEKLLDTVYTMSKLVVRFDNSDGKWIQITIRMPSEFREAIERYCGPYGIFSSFLYFFKCSIMYGIESQEQLAVPTDEMLSEVERILSQKAAIRKGA